jgi:putative spermidine/putrescine transport system permease protein
LHIAGRVAGTLVVLAILGFVVLPAFVVTLAAFNDKAILAFPPQAWSWRWFAKALAYSDFRAGFGNGLIVTGWASSIALLVGGAFAFALDRYTFAYKRTIEAILLSTLIVPHFTIGLGFLILAAQIGLARGFAVVVVTVTLPLLLPGLVGGWLLAAILSFNEFTASLFVTAQRTQTLPVAMYNYVREYADPSLAAVSVIYIAATATLLIVANAYLGLGKLLNVEPRR